MVPFVGYAVNVTTWPVTVGLGEPEQVTEGTEFVDWMAKAPYTVRLMPPQLPVISKS